MGLCSDAAVSSRQRYSRCITGMEPSWGGSAEGKPLFGWLSPRDEPFSRGEYRELQPGSCLCSPVSASQEMLSPATE